MTAPLAIGIVAGLLVAAAYAFGYLLGLRAGHGQGMQVGYHLGLQNHLADLARLADSHPILNRRANRDRAPAAPASELSS